MTTSAYPVPVYPPVPLAAYSARPNAAFALSLVGGALIVLGGVSELILAYTLPNIYATVASFYIFGWIGVALGAVVVLFGGLTFVRPQHHVVFGAIVVIASLLSVVAYWGFVVGLVLGLVGGVLAITWTPPPTVFATWGGLVSPTGPVIPGRACLRCGFLTARDARFCPHCGSPFPTA